MRAKIKSNKEEEQQRKQEGPVGKHSRSQGSADFSKIELPVRARVSIEAAHGIHARRKQLCGRAISQEDREPQAKTNEIAA